jgi:hypothetical protein
VAQDYDALDIIVSDNFSQDETAHVVASFDDPRIKYINTGRRVSMSHNWEFALSHVTDGWVLFLGDDDGLCLDALDLLNTQILKYGVEAVSCQKYVNYTWPGHFEQNPDGSFTICSSHSVRVRNSREVIREVFAGRVLAFHELPMCYHGAASIELINRLRHPDGRFFCSQVPDIYSAVAFSMGTEHFLSMDMPFTIGGISRHSTGISNLSRATGDGKTPVQTFQSEANIPFHPSLVCGKSTHMMLYEAYLQSDHIHHNGLGLNLAEQLQVAYLRAPHGHVAEVARECDEIATKNGLVFTPAKQRFKAARALLRIPASISYFLGRVSFNPRTTGIHNVYEAAVFATFMRRVLASSFYYRACFGLSNLAKEFRRKFGFEQVA